MRGGDPRPTNPTPADVAALARKRLYRVIPKLHRIAMNIPKRSVKGKNKGKRGGKPPYSAANQIRAIAELRLLAQDRMLSEAQVPERLIQLVDKTHQILPPELAKAYLKEIAPLFAADTGRRERRLLGRLTLRTFAYNSETRGPATGVEWRELPELRSVSVNRERGGMVPVRSAIPALQELDRSRAAEVCASCQHTRGDHPPSATFGTGPCKACDCAGFQEKAP